MSCRYLLAVLPFVLLTISGSAAADHESLQSAVREADSVDEAVARITEALEDQGFEIPLVVNHAAAADSVGLSLRPTQVVFARPPRHLERHLLRRAASIGIDLPVKFLVFEDESGEIQLRSNGIGYLIDRHDLFVFDPALWHLRSVSEQFGDPKEGLITLRSQRSISETVDALREAISSNAAFRIPLVLEYSGRRHSESVLIVFGNPNAGTPLMQATQEVALDLPQKFLVWKRQGEVFITYNDPFFVGSRHNVQGQDMRLGAIATALANFARAGAGTSDN